MISSLWSDYIKSAISIYIGSPVPPSFYDNTGDDDDKNCDDDDNDHNDDDDDDGEFAKSVPDNVDIDNIGVQNACYWKYWHWQYWYGQLWPYMVYILIFAMVL